MCVFVCLCYYAFPNDHTILKRACMLCRETTLCTVARKMQNCAGNEIVLYVKASDCLHDCISVTCTWWSHPAFILKIYLRLNCILLSTVAQGGCPRALYFSRLLQ